MKGGHDQTKSRCGFYSKLEYCEGVVEELGGGGGSCRVRSRDGVACVVFLYPVLPVHCHLYT